MLNRSKYAQHARDWRRRVGGIENSFRRLQMAQLPQNTPDNFSDGNDVTNLHLVAPHGDSLGSKRAT